MDRYSFDKHRNKPLNPQLATTTALAVVFALAQRYANSGLVL